jgi:hypothetical protein
MSVGASVMHERAVETCEPSCMPRVAKPFFIPVVHSPPGAVGHMVALELPSRKGRALSCGTRGSTGGPLSGRQRPEPWTCGSAGAPLVKEARSEVEGHVAAMELTSVRRQGQQGGEVRGHVTHGGTGAHLCREVWSEATAYVAARECMPCSLS